jgi:hypothetical protein
LVRVHVGDIETSLRRIDTLIVESELQGRAAARPQLSLAAPILDFPPEEQTLCSQESKWMLLRRRHDPTGTFVLACQTSQPTRIQVLFSQRQYIDLRNIEIGCSHSHVESCIFPRMRCTNYTAKSPA